jgi:hypothetical protein
LLYPAELRAHIIACLVFSVHRGSQAICTARRSGEQAQKVARSDASAIQALTPSDVFSWPGPDVRLTGQSKRAGIENNWYALTGRVVAVKVEMDGDLHLAVQDATGDKAGIVVL